MENYGDIAMRKYQKKQLSEKFELLHEAHQCVENIMRDEQNAASLLSDCQGLAIEIGTDIENIEGKDIKTIALLEDYCELCYQISERKFPTSYTQMAGVVKKELDNNIKCAEESFKEDIEEQTIIVFFPYKASMWDSMETIWRKYQNDDSVQTIVVPLPYYIKDQEQNKVKKCFEGEAFPAEVPIMNYEDFLRGKYYADIVIYHNSYDNTNDVTEVDSRFFSSRLHEYAHMIVYIPYYVLACKPELSFVLTPGVKNADYVILQDEEIAEEFRKWYPNKRDKFLALGSPKIDKAIEMSHFPKDELNIPEDWKERISGKKVLFYNTHLVNFLDENRDFIGKLKSVFELVKKQNDIVLWWRPHPLSEDMEYNTTSELFQKYEELVQWYKEEDIGIYDDTPNLHEAIAVADAYYGDQSSLVKLFQSVGKPVMIQTDGVQKRVAEDCVIYDNKVWYSSLIYNALCYIDLETGEGKFVDFFPEEELSAKWLYKKIFLYNDHLYFIPWCAKNMCVYDIKNNSFEKIIINTEVTQKKFYTGVIQEEYLILLPYKAAYVIRINLVNHKVEYLKEFETLLRDKNSPMYGREYLFANAYLGSDGIIYATVDVEDVVVGYDIKTKQVFYKMLGNNGKKYFDVLQQGNEVYFSSYFDHTFVIWNTSDDIIKEISYKKCADENNLSIEFVRFSLYEGRLYLHLYDSSTYLYFEKEKIAGWECLSEHDDIAVMKQWHNILIFFPLSKTRMEYLYIKNLVTDDILKISINDKVEEQRLLASLHLYLYQN